MLDYVVIAFGYLLFVAELLIARSGVLATAAVGTLLVGVLLLIVNPPAPTPIAPILLVAIVILTIALALFLARGLITTSGRLARTGLEGMPGRSGEALAEIDPFGQVRVAGEIWRAELAPGFERIQKGEKVLVIGVNGLTVLVAPTALPKGDREDIDA